MAHYDGTGNEIIAQTGGIVHVCVCVCAYVCAHACVCVRARMCVHAHTYVHGNVGVFINKVYLCAPFQCTHAHTPMVH